MSCLVVTRLISAHARRGYRVKPSKATVWFKKVSPGTEWCDLFLGDSRLSNCYFPPQNGTNYWILKHLKFKKKNFFLCVCVCVCVGGVPSDPLARTFCYLIDLRSVLIFMKPKGPVPLQLVLCFCLLALRRKRG